MNATRRFSIAALVVACTHLVFGAIVRISGSGMGCGNNWPKCYGYWIPPFSRPDLIVEVSHRYLASILTLTVLSMAFVAWRHRNEPGVGGKGGVMRSAFGAVGAVFAAAILGGVTVKMGNAPWATVAHWLVAMTLLAMVATTAIRAGALGGTSSLVQRGSPKTARAGFAAAVLAIFAVALGGLTAKLPGAAVGCTTIPMCGANPAVEASSVHVQLTHRTIAVLLVLHLIGMVMMLRKRRATEAPVVVRAAHVALGMVLLQLVVASSMILLHLPPVLRSLHEATGVGIWLSCFTLAYLARRAAQTPLGEPAAVVPVGSAPGRGVTETVRHSERSEEPTVLAYELAQAPSLSADAVGPSVAALPQDDDVADEDDRDVILEELDWEPKSAIAKPDELDEFSVAALEADLATLEAEAKAAEEVKPAEIKAAPIERVAGESNLVAPPVEAPKLSPLPPAPTMAVIVARGADLL